MTEPTFTYMIESALSEEPSKPRKASQVEPPGFPFRSSGVTLLLIKPDGTVRSSNDMTGKRSLALQAIEGTLLLGAWTGKWRTDIFLIDDPAAASNALGLP